MNSAKSTEWEWEALDWQLARFLSESESDEKSTVVEQAVQILSHEVRQGHVCISLEDYCEIQLDSGGMTPAVDDWRQSLLSSRGIGNPDELKPVILDKHNRLYFHRYFQYEQELAKMLLEKQQNSSPLLSDETDKNADFSFELSKEQEAAVMNSVSRYFSIISGGPGTGKTTIIASLLLRLLKIQPESRIALAAPTGKAAARMQEAISQLAVTFADKDTDLFPQEAVTLHRLLGYQQGKVTFRYHRDHPLPFNVVIVDEASMIDLAMMNKLVSAVSDDARLILIGDRYQLASVEAGSVFGEICSDSSKNRLSENLSLLSHSYRFKSKQGIGKLASAINAGEVEEVINHLNDPELTQIEWLNPDNDSALWQQKLKQKIYQQLKEIQLASEEEKFRKLAQFQLLCAHTKGVYGVSGLTNRIDQWVQQKTPGAHKNWYNGMPLMVTENDYQAKLFNGDYGIVSIDSGEKPRILFPQSQSENSRKISIARLPAYENAWAISVHKSQGSEFNEVMLILPEQPSAVISRELLYTAVTRAKTKVTIVSNEAVLRHAVKYRIKRRSGLAEKLEQLS